MMKLPAFATATAAAMAPAPASTPLVAVDAAKHDTAEDGIASQPPLTNPTNPTTPTSPSPQLLSQPVLDAKDRRAYEVARQRAKRPEDRRKAKNQKKGAKKNGLFAGSRGGNLQVGEDEDAAVVALSCGKGAVVHESLSMPEVASYGIAINDMKPDVHEVGVTVRLEDLIRVAKVRKDKAGDFEVVPHVRAVIALDESDFAGETTGGTKLSNLEFDDWEHVDSCSDTSSSEEDEPRKAPSYAQVVSSKKE